MSIFDIHHTLVTIFGYPLSYIECTGVIFGLLCVWLAAIENILNWFTGLINIICFFIIFYQVSLYADMFLQIYFFSISIYGWIKWSQQKQTNKPITLISSKARWQIAAIIVVGSIAWGFIVKNLPHFFPYAFPKQAAYPFVDAFITVCSIIANVLLAKRILENWALWVLIDFICIFVYALKHIRFISFEYGILLIISAYGLWQWIKQYKASQEKVRNNDFQKNPSTLS